MIEVARLSDPVLLSYLRAELEAAGVEVFVFDEGSPWPGAIPVRLLVDEADAATARAIVAQARQAGGG
jgi:hypothetical protein